MPSIAGSQVLHQQEHRLNSLKRVLLVDPSSAYMQSLIPIQKENGLGFPTMVQNVSRHCQRKNIPVRWSDKPIMNIVISNPDDSDAWARVQTFIPYRVGQYSPSYVVTKKDRPELFETLKGAFQEMWKESQEPELNQ